MLRHKTFALIIAMMAPFIIAAGGGPTIPVTTENQTSSRIPVAPGNSVTYTFTDEPGLTLTVTSHSMDMFNRINAIEGQPVTSIRRNTCTNVVRFLGIPIARLVIGGTIQYFAGSYRSPGKILMADMVGTRAFSGFHSWSGERVSVHPGYGVYFRNSALLQGEATLSYQVATPITTFHGTKRLASTMLINSRGVFCK